MSNATVGNSSASEATGSGDYVVRQGECIDSIAFESGHVWTTIWNDPSNAALARARGHPNVLLPGDHLTIPPIRVQEHDCATDHAHRFCRKGAQSMLRLRLLEEGEPRENVDYILEIDGIANTGTTDAQGMICVRIPPGAKQGKLRLSVEGATEEYALLLGHMDPARTVSGAQSRLMNLGFDVGPIDGRLGPRTEGALRTFQRANRLHETGALDSATIAKLEQLYGG